MSESSRMTARAARHKAYGNAWFAEPLQPMYPRWLEYHPPKVPVFKQLLLFD